ncbi:MAG: biotin/lipoyl-binding protein [candidate division Zixibacteria bacterium]|nr:biotin/lipoyl-binding protein [candidate division Zixibacteria bacterium]
MSTHIFNSKGADYESIVSRTGNEYSILIGEEEFRAKAVDSTTVEITITDKTYQAKVAVAGDHVFVLINGRQIELRLQGDDNNSWTGYSADESPDKIISPMPGKIVKLFVKVGDYVKEKQPLVIVESMKMENQIVAQCSGKVKSVNFKEGAQVDSERPIIELEI